VAAEADFRRALAVDPRRTVSAIQLGEVLLSLGHKTEGAAALRRALELQPDNASVREALASAEGP
jgi:predicted Zn-dependent protease